MCNRDELGPWFRKRFKQPGIPVPPYRPSSQIENIHLNIRLLPTRRTITIGVLHECVGSPDKVW